MNEINRVASQTVYNDFNVLDGTRSGTIQVGTDAGQTVSFSISAIDTDTLGLTNDSFTDASTIDDIASETATTSATLALAKKSAFSPQRTPRTL